MKIKVNYKGQEIIVLVSNDNELQAFIDKFNKGMFEDYDIVG